MEMIEIVWTAPSGTNPQARVHAGQPCVVGDRAHITPHAFKKLSARGLCKKAPAAKGTAGKE
jgi:hypothetical protein